MSDTPAPAAVPAAPAATPATPAGPPVNEFETVLKKSPLKVKAGGKEHVIDSAEKVQRLLSRGLGLEENLETIAKQKAELTPVQQMFERIKSGDLTAMEEMLDSGKLDQWAEQRLRKHYEREKQQEGMSQREKEMAAALEQERNERQKLDSERKKVEDEKKQQAEAQQLSQVRAHIEGNVIETLKMLDLPPKLSPIAVEFMKPIIRASLGAGVGLDPNVLAEKVRPVLQELFAYQTKGLEGEKLLSLFGDDVGRKYRAALLAKVKGGSAPIPPPAEGDKKPTEPKPSGWDPRKMW